MDAYDQDAADDDAPDSVPNARRLASRAIAALAIMSVAVAMAVVQPWNQLVDDEGVRPFAATRTAPADVRARLARAAETDRSGSDPLDQDEVGETARAVFGGRDGHTADGQARIVDLADGRRVLRIEDLAIPDGPDLEVYLSPAPGDALTAEFIDQAVSLGPLVYNQGDSNYEIPGDVDPNAYRSVTIWSPSTGVNFAVAGFR